MVVLLAAACAARTEVPVLAPPPPPPTALAPAAPPEPPSHAPATRPSSEVAAAAETEGPSTVPRVGHSAPPLGVHSLNGAGPVSLERWAGKVVLITFWATWCEPCKTSLPHLQRLSTALKGDLEILGLSEDDDLGGVKAYGAQYGLRFALAWDKDKDLANRWQVNAMPMTYVLDRKGVVRFVHRGSQPGDQAELEREVRSLL